MKEHPYLAAFVLAWLLALPAVFVRYPEFSFFGKILAGSLRGLFPMLAGWATVYLNRKNEPQKQFERSMLAVTFVSIVFFALAVWAAEQGPAF